MSFASLHAQPHTVPMTASDAAPDICVADGRREAKLPRPGGHVLLHRPGPGCPCGCTYDNQTHRCIEPWFPPSDGNDLGQLYIG